MDFEVSNRMLLEIWGFAVALGWISSYFLYSFFEPLQLVALWSVLMSVPVIVSIKWMSQNSGTSLPVTWILTVSLAIGAAAAVLEGYLMVPEIETYAVFWFFLPALAFSVTTYYFEGIISHLYVSAAVVNFGIAMMLLMQPQVMNYHYILAAVFQGLPILYHAYYEY